MTVQSYSNTDRMITYNSLNADGYLCQNFRMRIVPTHFIELYIEPFGTLYESGVNDIMYLEHYLSSSRSKRIKTIAIWKIKQKSIPLLSTK